MNKFMLNETSYHGAGAIQAIPEEIKSRGFKKAFVASAPDLVKFGVTKKVTDLLEKAGIEYKLYSDIKPNPTIENVQHGVGEFKACGADCIIMPCNTAHYFLPQLQAKTETPFLSMLAATAKTCAAKFPGKTAAVLGTKGTLATGLYDRALEGEGVAFILPDEAERDTLMHLIYDVVKASKPLAPEQGTWEALLNGLRARGADYFILGCTELPIVADSLPVEGPFVDPTAELAKAAIRFCGCETLED